MKMKIKKKEENNTEHQRQETNSKRGKTKVWREEQRKKNQLSISVINLASRLCAGHRTWTWTWVRYWLGWMGKYQFNFCDHIRFDTNSAHHKWDVCVEGEGGCYLVVYSIFCSGCMAIRLWILCHVLCNIYHPNMWISNSGLSGIWLILIGRFVTKLGFRVQSRKGFCWDFFGFWKYFEMK